MKIILTGPKGNLGYWDANPRKVGQHAFGFNGHFKGNSQCAFAGRSSSAVNSNYAPTGHDGTITSDRILALLSEIASG